MTNTDKRRLLIDELMNLKSESLRVFINNLNDIVYSNYGLISDNKNIIYVQFGECSNLFETVFEWVPSRKNGSGCLTLEKGYGYEHLSKEVFYEAVNEGKRLANKYGAELYTNLEQFLKKDIYTETHYIEL